MLVISQLSTKQLTPAYISLSWVIQSTSELLSGYVFNVLKSGVETTNLWEFSVIASGLNPQTVYGYNDTAVVGITSKFADFYYRIQISGLTGQGVSYSDVAYISVVEDKYAREIERRRGVVFDYHSGQPFFLLKRRDYGTYCPVCYDTTLQRTIKSGDTTCYDTGFLGGYFGPESIVGQLMERPVQERHTMFSAWQDQDAVLYTTSMPSINPKDIIVDRLSRRWMVQNVGSYSKGTHSIGQIIQVRQIEKNSVAYQFPVTY
jgi:hypothetical protein